MLCAVTIPLFPPGRLIDFTRHAIFHPQLIFERNRRAEAEQRGADHSLLASPTDRAWLRGVRKLTRPIQLSVQNSHKSVFIVRPACLGVSQSGLGI